MTSRVPIPISMTCAITALALLAPGAVRAAPPAEIGGTIVRVDARELFVDLGADQGLEAGDVLQVFRRVEIQHPVTRRTLIDRFPIGEVVVTEAGRLLSIVDDYAGLDPAPRVGDLVVRARDAAPATSASSPIAPATPTDRGKVECGPCDERPRADPLSALFESTLGLPLGERIALWQGWLRDHPTSPRAAVARDEIAALSRLDAPAAPKAVDKPLGPTLTARVALPGRATTDRPFDIYLATLPREEVVATRLLLRRASETGYTTVALEPDGRLGHRAVIDGPWLAPGRLLARVEVVRPSGAVEVVSGPADRVVEIEAPQRDAVDERGRSRAGVRFDLVSFWVDDDDDWFVRVEGDFRYRISEGVLEAFRMGVGMFEGRGGPTEALDEGLSDGEARSVNYGFAEVELALHRLFGASGKLLVGSYQPGDRREPLASLFGAALEVRVGEIDATRLYGGIQSTEHIGDEMWLRVAIAEVEGWPMEASVVVTDLPVGADYGVSLGYGLTWQASDLFAATLRVGWNARTINHSGFTVGSAVVLSW
ncbi:MAG: hypothetical protein IT385_07880 [Deltaproteobacteria bacterium]|nr:hypothetical protein [Deltaproteobacteria bacterium]